MKANTWLWITFGIVIIILVGAIIITYPEWFGVGESTAKKSSCPHDTHQCEDGSFVRRIEPLCDFAQCPAVAGTSTDSTSFDVKG